jgi:small-conductance mechanosensitive channel
VDDLSLVFAELREVLDWAPAPMVAAVILGAAVTLALGLHGAVLRLLSRLFRNRPYVRAFLDETRTLTRLALLVFVLSLALSAVPLDRATIGILRKLLLVSAIGLIGWGIVIALQLAARLHLMRYRIDVEDNLLARKHVTQVRILLRAVDVLVVILTIGIALMTFESVRQYGVSLFASAGVAGLVIGLAARPVLSNLLAGVQLAVTQPIRIDDAVIVENEWGWIEEITSTYVVVRLWDWRRLVVPLSYFIEKPFQNWTREGSALIGSVMLYLDYNAPIDDIRAKAKEIAANSKLWDRQVVNVQVTDSKDDTIEVRILVSAASAPVAWDLRCEMREKMIVFLQQAHPLALPRRRQEIVSLPAPPLAPGGHQQDAARIRAAAAAK